MCFTGEYSTVVRVEIVLYRRLSVHIAKEFSLNVTELHGWGRSVFVIIVVFCIIAGCSQKEMVEAPKNPIALDSVVIEEFDGIKLSSLCAGGGDHATEPVKIDVSKYVLSVIGLVASVQAHSYDEVLNLQHYTKRIRLVSVHEWEETIECEGVLVNDLISQAGPSPAAKGVIFRSRDGYLVTFPISYILGKKILLVHQINGKPLTPSSGFPFILASESKHGQDWGKWVTEIELMESDYSDPSFMDELDLGD